MRKQFRSGSFAFENMVETGRQMPKPAAVGIMIDKDLSRRYNFCIHRILNLICPYEREKRMIHNRQILLLTGILVLFLAAILIAKIRNAVRKNKERKQRDFSRKLTTLLREKETVKSVCPQKGGRWILTNNRLIIEKKGNFQAFPLKEIKSIQGTNAAGNRTTAVRNMVRLTVKMDEDRVLVNKCKAFAEFASLLQAEMKKRKAKEKTPTQKK